MKQDEGRRPQRRKEEREFSQVCHNRNYTYCGRSGYEYETHHQKTGVTRAPEQVVKLQPREKGDYPIDDGLLRSQELVLFHVPFAWR